MLGRMKSKTTALGTVSALMALAVTASAQQVVYSSITNLSISLSAPIDLNNDGTNDLIIFGNSSDFSIEDAGAGDVLIDTNSSGLTALYNPGDTVSVSDPSASIATATDLLGLGISYVGFTFSLEGLPHAGWIELDLPTDTPGDGTLVAAAWAADPNTSITIPSDVPEPATTALAVLGGLAGMCRRRRIKSDGQDRH